MKKKLDNTSSIIIILVFFIISGCGGGGSGGTKNLGPVVSANAPGMIEERSNAQLSINARDPDGSIREIRWVQTSGPRINFTNGNEIMHFVAPEVSADSDFSFMVSVIDDVGAITTVDIYSTILNVNRAPETADVTFQVEINTSVEFTFSATDPDNDLLSYQITQQPLSGVLEILDSQNNTYRYTPNADSLIDDEVIIEVSDGSLSVSATLLFDIFDPQATKSLIISEVSSSLYWDDNRWIELYNNTGNEINLADYIIKTDMINLTEFSNSQNMTTSLPEIIIKPESYIVIQYSFANKLWPLEIENNDQLVIIDGEYDDMRPTWSNSGFVELLDNKQIKTVDFVRFGKSIQVPVSTGHWVKRSINTFEFETYGKNLVRSVNSPDTNSFDDWRYSVFPTPASANPVEK